MHGLVELTKAHAARATGRIAQNRIGLVTSYDPATGMAKVEYQPDGVLSPWLQRTAPVVGNGWGLHAPLPIGAMVLVAPVEGDADAGVIMGTIYSAKALPPGAADGEVVLRSEAGAVIELLAGGKAVMRDAGGTSLSMLNNGTAAINGVLAVTGSLEVTGNVGIAGNVAVTGGPITQNGTTVVVP